MEDDCPHGYGDGGTARRAAHVARPTTTDHDEAWPHWEDQILMVSHGAADDEDGYQEEEEKDEVERGGAMLTDPSLFMIHEAETFNLQNEVALWSRAEAQVCAVSEAEFVYKYEEEKDLELAEIAEKDNVQRFLMMQSLMNGSKYLINEKKAEEADYQDLICVQQAAKLLLQLVDQTICKKMEEERLKAVNECSKAMCKQKEIEDAAAKERVQLNLEISKLKRDYRLLNEKLEWERDRSTCRICFTKARDILILPCMHFHYCHACLNRHQKTSNICPTCRSPISGVLKYNLSID